MPRGAKYCAGTVTRSEKILLFDVTIKKGISPQLLLRLLRLLNKEAKLNLGRIARAPEEKDTPKKEAPSSPRRRKESDPSDAQHNVRDHEGIDDEEQTDEEQTDEEQTDEEQTDEEQTDEEQTDEEQTDDEEGDHDEIDETDAPDELADQEDANEEDEATNNVVSGNPPKENSPENRSQAPTKGNTNAPNIPPPPPRPPEVGTLLKHLPNLRAMTRTRAQALTERESGEFAYMPEALDGAPLLLLSRPGAQVEPRMRLAGTVGAEGRYRCMAPGRLTLSHGNFPLGPLERDLGIQLRFAPAQRPRLRPIKPIPMADLIPIARPAPLPPRPRSRTIVGSNVPTLSLKGSGGQNMQFAFSPNGEVHLTAPQPPVQRVTFSGGGGKGAALPGAVRALERSGVLKDLREVSGASVGSMTAALVATGVTADEFEDIGNDPAVATQIKQHKNMAEVIFGGGLDGSGMENLVRGKTSSCLRKRIAEYMEARILENEPVDPEVKRVQERLADGKKGPTFGELRTLSRIIPAIKEVSISASYVAELDPSTRKPLPFARPQLAMFNADTEPDMEVALAVHASAALPPVFKPVDIALSSGILARFQDGGVLNNAPSPETLGVERDLDPVPQKGGMTFVFEEDASREILQGKAVPRRSRLADWLTKAGNSAAEYAKNRALADRPEDVVMVPLIYSLRPGRDLDFSGLLSGTTNFDMDLENKLQLQTLSDQATSAHIQKRREPRTRTFRTKAEMFMGIALEDLRELARQEMEGAKAALAFREGVQNAVEELRKKLHGQSPRAAAADPAVRTLLDSIQERSGGRPERMALVAREINRFPELDVLLDAFRSTGSHPALAAAQELNAGLVAQAHAKTILRDLIYPKIVTLDPDSSNGQFLALIDNRLRALQTPKALDETLTLAVRHFQKTSDPLGYHGHKEFAQQLEARRNALLPRANP